MSTRTIYFSRFFPTYRMGGGCRRMMQIYELLAGIFPKLQLIDQSWGDDAQAMRIKKIRTSSKRTDFFAPHRRSISIRKWEGERLSMAFRFRKLSLLWLRSIPELPALKLAFMDDPIYFLPLLKQLLRWRIPVIAICHNFETLAPGQVKKKQAIDFFQEELEVLSRCRLVVTISREEDVLLNNLGIPSLFFPYYPGEPIVQRLLAVRAERISTLKQGFLALGNAMNTQTREGLRRLGHFWQENKLAAIAGKLILGGFKAEKFLNAAEFGFGIDFLGTMDPVNLDRLLARIKAFLCYQKDGSGALTRICEMLIAGIPVLANSHAARSYYHMKGLIEFRDLDSLANALGQLNEFHGEVPAPRKPDPTPLISCLQEYSGGGN